MPGPESCYSLKWPAVAVLCCCGTFVPRLYPPAHTLTRRPPFLRRGFFRLWKQHYKRGERLPSCAVNCFEGRSLTLCAHLYRGKGIAGCDIYLRVYFYINWTRGFYTRQNTKTFCSSDYWVKILIAITSKHILTWNEGKMLQSIPAYWSSQSFTNKGG